MVDHLLRPIRVQAICSMSRQTAQVLDLSDRGGWNAQVLGRAPMPEAPIFFRQWWIVPASQDTSVIPQRAMERLKALDVAGIRPRGFVIIHDAPRALPSPAPRRSSVPETPSKKGLSIPPQVVVAAEGVVVGIMVLPLVMKLVVAAVSAVLAALVVPALAVGLVGAALLVDPVLVAVTEDGYWIVIDQWWN